MLDKDFCIKNSLNELKINCTFIHYFFKELWNYPEAIFYLLKNSEAEIVQTNLASFICDNLFSNHLSGNYMENNLLYIFAMMLKDKIEK